MYITYLLLGKTTTNSYHIIFLLLLFFVLNSYLLYVATRMSDVKTFDTKKTQLETLPSKVPQGEKYELNLL